MSPVSALPSPAPDDRPPDSDHNLADAIPEWAPVEPLPSSEMLLAAFAGLTPITATDILDPASDLVICQERYRLAFEVLASGAVANERVQSVATALVSAREEIELLTTIIDDAVGKRLLCRRQDGTHGAGPRMRTPAQCRYIRSRSGRSRPGWPRYGKWSTPTRVLSMICRKPTA